MSSMRGSGDSPRQHTSCGSFQSPFEVDSPPGGEGWEEMYPYHLLFSADRRDFDDDRFWFQDSLHWPEPLRPFDAVVVEYAVVALNQANARLFVVPSSLGVEFRLLNGSEYLSANAVVDEAALARRSELFAKRAGYYYEHWDELYASWRTKVEDATLSLIRLEVPSLPEFEDEAAVTEGRGWGSTHALLVAFDRLLESLDRLWQYHFEFLAAVLDQAVAPAGSAAWPHPRRRDGRDGDRQRRWGRLASSARNLPDEHQPAVVRTGRTQPGCCATSLLPRCMSR